MEARGCLGESSKRNARMISRCTCMKELNEHLAVARVKYLEGLWYIRIGEIITFGALRARERRVIRRTARLLNFMCRACISAGTVKFRYRKLR